jgi:hypothetical protein
MDGVCPVEAYATGGGVDLEEPVTIIITTGGTDDDQPRLHIMVHHDLQLGACSVALDRDEVALRIRLQLSDSPGSPQLRHI